MKLKNISSKIIFVDNRTVMPGDEIECGDEIAQHGPVKALIRHGDLAAYGAGPEPATRNVEEEIRKAVEEARKVAFEEARKVAFEEGRRAALKGTTKSEVNRKPPDEDAGKEAARKATSDKKAVSDKATKDKAIKPAKTTDKK